jgi:hypothetical protein
LFWYDHAATIASCCFTPRRKSLRTKRLHLRHAAVPVGIDPWVYGLCGAVRTLEWWQDPVHQDCRTLDVRLEKMIRSGQFTANRALVRERLGAIPLLIDDVTRDKSPATCPTWCAPIRR